MLVSFAVPVYNAEATVVKTLDSILAQDYGGPMELVIVDDGSTDGSARLVREWIARNDDGERLKRIEFIQIEHSGEAEAMNVATTAAIGERIAWVESDVILDKRWLTVLMDSLEEDEDVMGAGGLLLPAPDDGPAAKIFGYEVSCKIKTNKKYPRHITSANALYNRRVFDDLGPCRADLGESSFDAVHNQRILALGWRLRFNPEAVAWHHFKPGLIACLKRAWWYGAKRPQIDTQVLYPMDRWTGATVLAAAAAIAVPIIAPVSPPAAITILAVSLATHLGYSVILFAHFPDPVLIPSAPVFLVRNLVFFAGYLRGWAGRLFGRRRRPE